MDKLYTQYASQMIEAKMQKVDWSALIMKDEEEEEKANLLCAYCACCGEPGDRMFDDKSQTRVLCNGCLEGGKKSGIIDGITHKVIGPGGKYYYVPCRYLSGKKCPFVCLPYVEKWPDSNPTFSCLGKKDGDEKFSELFKLGRWALCEQ